MANKIGYKRKLLNVSQMKATGIERLHERVIVLVEVFDDSEFRADIGGDDFAIAAVLDKYVDDCALGFLQLRSVLQVFPAAEEWKATNLRALHASAIERSKPLGQEPVKHERRTVKVADFDELQEQFKDATCRANTLVDEITELRAENRRLLSENAKLEGRIVELERSCARQFAGTAR